MLRAELGNVDVDFDVEEGAFEADVEAAARGRCDLEQADTAVYVDVARLDEMRGERDLLCTKPGTRGR